MSQRFPGNAHKLLELLAGAIAQLAFEGPADLPVVAVLLHRSKFTVRGFNQSRLLAAETIASLRKTHPHWRLTAAPTTLMR